MLTTARRSLLLTLVVLALAQRESLGFTLPILDGRARGVYGKLEATRSEVIHSALATAAALVLVLPPQSATAIPPQKSYSTNARNMERRNAGDASAGSVYDNNPSTPAARRRRAMQGCKVPSARDRATQILTSANSTRSNGLSEKDCNMQVMSSSPDFMLQAIQELDCPTCPYGIQP